VNYPWAMALSAATVFVLGGLVAALGPERRGVAFGRDGGWGGAEGEPAAEQGSWFFVLL